MRAQEFNAGRDGEQQLFCCVINVKAMSRTRLQPFYSNKLSVSFPLLDAAISEPENVIMDNGEIFQIITFCVGIGLFAENRIQARNDVLNATLVTVEGQDGQLNLVEPEITIVGEISHVY